MLSQTVRSATSWTPRFRLCFPCCGHWQAPVVHVCWQTKRQKSRNWNLAFLGCPPTKSNFGWASVSLSSRRLQEPSKPSRTPWETAGSLQKLPKAFPELRKPSKTWILGSHFSEFTTTPCLKLVGGNQNSKKNVSIEKSLIP